MNKVEQINEFIETLIETRSMLKAKKAIRTSKKIDKEFEDKLSTQYSNYLKEVRKVVKKPLVKIKKVREQIKNLNEFLVLYDKNHKNLTTKVVPFVTESKATLLAVGDYYITDKEAVIFAYMEKQAVSFAFKEIVYSLGKELIEENKIDKIKIVFLPDIEAYTEYLVGEPYNCMEYEIKELEVKTEIDLLKRLSEEEVIDTIKEDGVKLTEKLEEALEYRYSMYMRAKMTITDNVFYKPETEIDYKLYLGYEQDKYIEMYHILKEYPKLIEDYRSRIDHTNRMAVEKQEEEAIGSFKKTVKKNTQIELISYTDEMEQYIDLTDEEIFATGLFESKKSEDYLKIIDRKRYLKDMDEMLDKGKEIIETVIKTGNLHYLEKREERKVVKKKMIETKEVLENTLKNVEVKKKITKDEWIKLQISRIEQSRHTETYKQSVGLKNLRKFKSIKELKDIFGWFVLALKEERILTKDFTVKLDKNVNLYKRATKRYYTKKLFEYRRMVEDYSLIEESKDKRHLTTKIKNLKEVENPLEDIVYKVFVKYGLKTFKFPVSIEKVFNQNLTKYEEANRYDKMKKLATMLSEKYMAQCLKFPVELDLYREELEEKWKIEERKEKQEDSEKLDYSEVVDLISMK